MIHIYIYVYTIVCIFYHIINIIIFTTSNNFVKH